MKVYLDVRKEKGVKYIEDEYSSADIVRTSREEFISMIKSFGEEIHMDLQKTLRNFLIK